MTARHMDAPLSIYIHIPFCETRCSYCAFNVHTGMEDRIPAYVAALQHELRLVAGSRPNLAAHTVYFGGGTPSLLPADCYRDILSCLRDSFTLADDAEISLEANPNDLSLDYLRQLRQAGINRLSIGMQSATDKILRLFDRRHDLAQVAESVAAAKAAGFDNFSLDVIFGSPDETLAEWQATVKAVISYAPTHISMYGLELKGGTPLRQRVDAGDLPAPDDDRFADMYESASAALAAASYEQYEISNWTRPGYECRHNLQYWRNLAWLGIGVGAHGFAAGMRYTVMASPDRYIAALASPKIKPMRFPLSPAVAKAQPVTAADDLYETVMMGLRLTREGINREAFRRRFHVDFVERFADALPKLQALGLIEIDAERVRLSEKGRLLSNAVIRELV